MCPEQSYNSFLPDLADAVKSARPSWVDIPTRNTAVSADVNGWPLTDAVLVVWEGIGASGLVDGAYYLEFQGQANVPSSARISRTPTMNYNPKTNMSSTTFTNHTHGQNQNFLITFTNTRRTPASPSNSDITNLKIMRPVSPGATTTLFHERHTLHSRIASGRPVYGSSLHDGHKWKHYAELVGSNNADLFYPIRANLWL
jgi:hypothetical protein